MGTDEEQRYYVPNIVDVCEPATMVERMSASVCAIGAINRDYRLALGRASEPPSQIDWEKFDIVGTGFVVEHDANLIKLMTNRHVVHALRMREPDQNHWAALFHDSLGGSEAKVGTLMGFRSFELEDCVYPGYQDGVTDFAFLTHYTKNMCDRDIFREQHPPIIFGPLTCQEIGARIGVMGYPLGNSLQFVREKNAAFRFTRTGPLLHQGHISGFAPRAPGNRKHVTLLNLRGITVMVTDMVAMKGMSGAPVFSFERGVIGIVFGGQEEWGIGFAIPLDQHRVWDLQLVEFARANKIDIREPIWPAGDLMPSDRNFLLPLIRQEFPEFARTIKTVRDRGIGYQADSNAVL